VWRHQIYGKVLTVYPANYFTRNKVLDLMMNHVIMCYLMWTLPYTSESGCRWKWNDKMIFGLRKPKKFQEKLAPKYVGNCLSYGMTFKRCHTLQIMILQVLHIPHSWHKKFIC
jgi:hypothetical protein